MACALDGAARFTGDCRAERVRRDGTLYLVVHHPDGGFRRFVIMNDGSGLAAADGADLATIRMAGTLIEVTVADDRYRIPATIERDARTP